MNKKEISLQVDGLNIVGEFYFPESPEGNLFPTLCLCHGIPAKPRDPTDRGYSLLAERFCATGFATFIFNFRGSGESEGNFDFPGWSRDLMAAIDFLSALPNVDITRLFLLGSSGGATVCIYVAAHDPRVTGVVTWACPAEFSLLVEAAQTGALIDHFRSIGLIRDSDFPPSVSEWIEGFKLVSAVKFIDQISPRPLLLIHGEDDDIVPLSHAQVLYEKAREPKEMVLIPGAEHRLRLDERAIVTALDWLKAKC